MIEALEVLGLPVEVVRPAFEKVEETVATLQQAAVVVGGHGANMANIIFAPPDIGVVEILPQAPFSLVDHHFRSLAGGLGQRYVPVGGIVTESDLDRSEM